MHCWYVFQAFFFVFPFLLPSSEVIRRHKDNDFDQHLQNLNAIEQKAFWNLRRDKPFETRLDSVLNCYSRAHLLHPIVLNVQSASWFVSVSRKGGFCVYFFLTTTCYLEWWYWHHTLLIKKVKKLLVLLTVWTVQWTY